MGQTTTWRQLVEEEMSHHRDSLDQPGITADIGLCENGGPQCICRTDPGKLAAEWLDIEFRNGYGEPEGHPFAMWTRQRVYFAAHYDGQQRCASVPRHPPECPGAPGWQALAHIGG